MRIAIIGTGNVGSTLGRRWVDLGHQVIFGVRDEKDPKLRTLLESLGDKAKAARIKKAAEAGDYVVLATPWLATEEAIHSAGSLKGKVLIDCTNPLLEEGPGLAVGLTTSAGEMVAKWARGAHVVKAFNTTGAKNMENPLYPSGKLTMFICGDDHEAKTTVARLGEELGFEVIDSGPIHVARWLEPLAMLWVHLAYVQGLGSNIGFKLLHRS